ncbi:SDR family oxidoreductase [Pirellulaceae bacterium]|nr:SDR family oxidoreductase [Pirellulaceae bacterium]
MVVITGGTSGIGLACVEKFAAAGDIVVTCARSTFNFENVMSDDLENIRLLSFDLGQPDAITKLIDFAVAEFQRIDVLINNAAIVPKASLGDLTEEDFQATVEVNLKPVFIGSQIAFRYFKSQGGGTIINMSSMAAVDPFPGFSLYGGCKAWIETFTRAIAAEGRDHGIFCASIRAGAVETPLLRKVLPDFPNEQAISPKAVADLIFATVNQRDFSISGQAIPIEQVV